MAFALNGAVSISVRRVLLLSLSAGYIEAIGYTDLNGIYPGIMTGNTVQMGISFAQGQWVRFGTVAIALLFFLIGGVIASLIRRHLRRPPVELILMALLLLAASVIRVVGGIHTRVELAVLALAMAMQGETISKFGAVSVQTVVATNNLLKFADGLVGRFGPALGEPMPISGSAARTDVANVLLPGGAWFGYVVGAASGAVAMAGWRVPLIVPAFLLIVTAADLLMMRGNDGQPPVGAGRVRAVLG